MINREKPYVAASLDGGPRRVFRRWSVAENLLHASYGNGHAMLLLIGYSSVCASAKCIRGI